MVIWLCLLCGAVLHFDEADESFCQIAESDALRTLSMPFYPQHCSEIAMARVVLSILTIFSFLLVFKV